MHIYICICAYINTNIRVYIYIYIHMRLTQPCNNHTYISKELTTTTKHLYVQRNNKAPLPDSEEKDGAI